MKKVQLSLNETVAQVDARSMSPSANAARRQLRQQNEELRVKVLDLAEHHMDVTLQVLRRWLQTPDI